MEQKRIITFVEFKRNCKYYNNGCFSYCNHPALKKCSCYHEDCPVWNKLKSSMKKDK